MHIGTKKNQNLIYRPVSSQLSGQSGEKSWDAGGQLDGSVDPMCGGGEGGQLHD